MSMGFFFFTGFVCDIKQNQKIFSNAQLTTTEKIPQWEMLRITVKLHPFSLFDRCVHALFRQLLFCYPNTFAKQWKCVCNTNFQSSGSIKQLRIATHSNISRAFHQKIARMQYRSVFSLKSIMEGMFFFAPSLTVINQCTMLGLLKIWTKQLCNTTRQWGNGYWTFFSVELCWSE